MIDSWIEMNPPISIIHSDWISLAIFFFFFFFVGYLIQPRLQLMIHHHHHRVVLRLANTIEYCPVHPSNNWVSSAVFVFNTALRVEAVRFVCKSWDYPLSPVVFCIENRPQTSDATRLASVWRGKRRSFANRSRVRIPQPLKLFLTIKNDIWIRFFWVFLNSSHLITSDIFFSNPFKSKPISRKGRRLLVCQQWQRAEFYKRISGSNPTVPTFFNDRNCFFFSYFKKNYSVISNRNKI